MKIQANIALAPFTTFKIGGKAKYFCEVKDQFDALEAFEFAQNKDLPVLLLGGGSNLLISDSGFNGLVIKVKNLGVEVLSENQNTVLLRVASGEIWDKVVEFAVKNKWWGIENLSHIPGSAGAIAVQNVGAYGQEAKNVIESVTVFDSQTHQILNLSNGDCNFAYRSSLFNTGAKGRYIIFYITFKLSKIPGPVLTYRDLAQKFGGQNPDLKQIREAVIEIRDKKFPFPKKAKNGNAGSFFKNPVLNAAEYQKLKNRVAGAFGQSARDALEAKKFSENGQIKIPAAFLMDICGLKDMRLGGAAINHNQPLVIINQTGKASALDVLNLAAVVLKTIKNKYGLALNSEPELVGFEKRELSAILKI